jgi:hypothetical protein
MSLSAAARSANADKRHAGPREKDPDIAMARLATRDVSSGLRLQPTSGPTTEMVVAASG